MIINTLYTEHPVSVQHGEVDCWPQDCPPLPCARPQHRPGTCCPVCEGGDTCGERVAMSNNETWCLDRGHAARDAGDTWHVTSLGPGCGQCLCQVTISTIYCIYHVSIRL